MSYNGVEGVRAMSRRQPNCRGCLASLGRLQEAWSLACRWLWGLGEVLARLVAHDRRERRELAEAESAQGRFIARVRAAMADGEITPTERAEVEAAGAVAMAEMRDLLVLNQHEDELHAEALHYSDHARASLAPLSRSGERVEAEANNYHGGLTEPVWVALDEHLIEA